MNSPRALSLESDINMLAMGEFLSVCLSRYGRKAREREKEPSLLTVSHSLIASGLNLNTRASIRNYAENFLIPKVIGKRLESHGLRWGPYATRHSKASSPDIVLNGPSTQPRNGRNAFGLTQSIAFLFEERGLRLANQHFQRRVASALIKIEALLEYSRDHTEEVRSIVEEARREFIESNDDVVVTDSPTGNLTRRPFSFVDRRNGSVVELEVGFYETRPEAVANLTRSRPEAYLIPAAWSDVVEKLEILGLKVQILNYEYRGLVGTLNITSSTLGKRIYEGHVLNEVTTSAHQREVHLPVGSFLISTRQQNAALAFVALEPEGVDSYVTFGFIPMYVGDEYPIFSIPRK